jgi:hypothetical protein
VKQTCPAIYEQQELTMCGFAGREFVSYHGNILTEEGCLNKIRYQGQGKVVPVPN